jgi:hypothetical protein
MGLRLLGPHPSNPRGHFEDEDFLALHRAILGELDDAGAVIPGRWRYPCAEFAPHAVAYRALIDDRSRQPLWGLKDPRLCHLLPRFLECYDGPLRVVCVERDAAAVARSLHAREQVTDPRFTLDAARLIVAAHSVALRRSLAAATARGPALFMRYDTILGDPDAAVGELAGFAGVAAGDCAAARDFVNCRQGPASMSLPILAQIPDQTVSSFCSKPFDRIKISADGAVNSCCWQWSGALGNVTTDDIAAIWRGPVAEAIRGDTLRGELHPACQTSGCNYLYRDRTAHNVRWDGHPRILEIDPPSTACNTACLMCPRSDSGFRSEEDRLDQVLEAVRGLIPRIDVIQVQGLSEPHWKGLLHRILDGLGYDCHAARIRVLTFTNGSTLDAPTRAQFFARVPRSLTFFSLDAATPATFRMIRKLDFATVCANLLGFAAERNRPTQALMMNNNINVLNVGEVEGMVELAAEAGCDGMTFNVTDPASDQIAGLTLHDLEGPAGVQMARRFRVAHHAILDRCAALTMPVRFYKPLDLGRAPGDPLPLTYLDGPY